MTDAVHVEIDGHVGAIEFSRPPANYFDQALLQQIADAAADLVEGGDIRAIVLASAGKHFCAGAN
ncbi:enoyl-CoA hydratase-related protein, partial [Streptomyces sp. NPDC050698]